MGALPVAERRVAIQIRLQLAQTSIQRLAEGHPEELFLHSAVEVPSGSEPNACNAKAPDVPSGCGAALLKRRLALVGVTPTDACSLTGQAGFL